MTTTQKPEPGTAVAAARRSELSPEQQRQVEARRSHMRMVQQIKGTVWSRDFDATTTAAVAAWAQQNDVEPIQEIDVLGGRLYLNSRYYERKLSELIGAQQIDYARPVWCHVDKRLEKLADAGDEAAKKESRRRLDLRIEYNLPDEADAACVFEIKHRHMVEPIRGAKSHIMGKKKTIKKKDGTSFTVDADPVGDQSPMETIETRALRRAMLKLKEAFPGVRIATSRDDDTIDVNAIVHGNYEEVKADREVKQLTPGESTFEAPTQEAEPVAATSTAVVEDDEDEILRQDRELAERERQGGLGIDDKPRGRSAVREGR